MDNKQTNSVPVDLSQLSDEQKEALRNQLNAEAKSERLGRRDAYEALRADFMYRIEENLINVVADTKSFKQWLARETAAFIDIMRQYGQVRRDEQMNYTITDGDFRLQIASNKVKSFDERADLAAARLIDYLKAYMERSEKGSEDQMYQLAMTLLERNQAGKLDYKSISKLYSMEDKFADEEYSDIMRLFRESNVVMDTVVNYYFYKQHKDTGVWMRIEPSFCRMGIESYSCREGEAEKEEETAREE